jgi:hypothetical protein
VQHCGKCHGLKNGDSQVSTKGKEQREEDVKTQGKQSISSDE